MTLKIIPGNLISTLTGTSRDIIAQAHRIFYENEIRNPTIYDGIMVMLGGIVSYLETKLVRLSNPVRTIRHVGDVHAVSAELIRKILENIISNYRNKLWPLSNGRRN